MHDSQASNEIVLQGIAASPGLAYGPSFIFLQKEFEVPRFDVPEDERDGEVQRFENALLTTRTEINELRAQVADKLGEEEAQIFDAHMLVLEDRALIEETIREHKETGFNIEHCFNTVARRYIDAFGRIDDEYIKERVTDIRDVTRRLMQKLLGYRGLGIDQWDQARIVVSEYISPSDTAALDRERVLAMLTNGGSRTSHAVIMARSLQVPAVVGMHDVTERVKTGDMLFVDGYEGLVVVNPSEATRLRYQKMRETRSRVRAVFQQACEEEAVCQDKHRFHLLANVEGEEDLGETSRNAAEGVGLYRTENLFLKQEQFPSEEGQFVVYKKMVEALEGKPITIRTLDLGGDKSLATCLFPEKEENPFMGFRAIRFCLEYSHLFKDQLRAILRASAFGKVKILYPMICCVNEVIQANRFLEEAKNELRERGLDFDASIEVGSMIEVPSAAYTIDLLAEHCAFFSIGTNDLIQYMLAVDRVNDRIAHLYQPNHPAVLRTIRHVVDQAHKKGVEVALCGEMAGDPLYAPLLMGMGLDALSLSPSSLPEIRYLLRKTSFKEAQALAKRVLEESNAKITFDLLRRYYFDLVGDVLSDDPS
ncbi:MAG: phosphoenolpyruvate--protein phosphotransferase [Opitutales bacterium]|tara:strand:+ start:1271 stop:3052 length:1782 start_codon:yes stop_codon:yes gene_type:complete